jgi:aconitate hydratase
MINGIGVLGWGVGGIEAEAAMLGQAITMLIPQVVGFKLTGKLPEGATATDLVLTITADAARAGRGRQVRRVLRRRPDHLPLADRATIANMSPEYGSTCGIFPIDEESLRYLSLSGRDRRTSGAGGSLPGPRACSARRQADPLTATCWNSTWPAWCPAWPGRNARRIACC